MDHETRNGLALVLGLLLVVLLSALGTGCAVPIVDDKLEEPEALAMCTASHRRAVAAAASCAELCIDQDLSNYCARKRCATELGHLAQWDGVQAFCWGKYTPELYHQRPKWPPKGLQPIV